MGITYNLDESYYNDAKKISIKVSSHIIKNNNLVLEDFMNFIKLKSIEDIRSKEEYGIELLMIGVMIKEYFKYANNLKKFNSYMLKGMNRLRNWERIKDEVDRYKGKLLTKLLIENYHKQEIATFTDFEQIINWMEVTGDFKEEVYRFKNWILFMKTKDRFYIESLFKSTLKEAIYLYEMGKEHLGKYTKNVESYLKTYKERHSGKEDIIYCGKGEIQYFFNMISAEIMNKVYKESFVKSKIKKIFIPACMRQTTKQCIGKKGKFGEICIGCSNNCNINKLRKLVEENNIEVNVIHHETILFKNKLDTNYTIGIVGVACMLNLLSGGLKAIRLGFKPQCVILEECGCKNHWLDKGIMTSINIDRLKDIIS